MSTTMSKRTSSVFNWGLLEQVHKQMKEEVSKGPL
jgi:hypothetical protein